jgi:flagellar basal-body rod protein FlgC
VHVSGAVDGLIARPDGNNVSLDREGLNLAEAQLKFKTGVALLHQEYQRMMDAIHADKVVPAVEDRQLRSRNWRSELRTRRPGRGVVDELVRMMETSGEAMQAERMRAEVVAANMANAETTRTATGGPYRRQHVVFAADRDDPAFLDFHVDASVSTRERSTGFTRLRGIPGFSRLRQLRPACILPRGRRSISSAQALRSGASRCGPDGYVSYPDINPLTEMVDLMGATRAYGLNSRRAGREGHDQRGAGDCEVIAGIRIDFDLRR